MNNWDFNLEDKITWDELAPSLQDLFKKLQKMIEDEIARAEAAEKALDQKIDNEISRAKSAEKKLDDRIDTVWGSDGELSSHDITEIWKKLGDVVGLVGKIKDTVNKNAEITVGTFGQSTSATPEEPNNRSDPNAIGEWLRLHLDIGDFDVYRHTKLTCYGMDVDENDSYLGYKNVKECEFYDQIYLNSLQNIPYTNFFVSFPITLAARLYMDSSHNIILLGGGTTQSAQSTDNTIGIDISDYTTIWYADLNLSISTLNQSEHWRQINNPKYSGTIVRVIQVTTSRPTGVRLSFIDVGITNVDDYETNKIYSAKELTQHIACPSLKRNQNYGPGTYMTTPLKYVSDSDWLRFINIKPTFNDIKNAILSIH